MHLRGYHLKANRLCEPLHKASAAFMAADSRTTRNTDNSSAWWDPQDVSAPRRPLTRILRIGRVACYSTPGTAYSRNLAYFAPTCSAF
jgi:hypothetical protein